MKLHKRLKLAIILLIAMLPYMGNHPKLAY